VFLISAFYLVHYEILGGSKIYIRGPAHPKGPLAEKFCHTHKYLPIFV